MIGAEQASTPREMKIDLGETTFDLQDTTIGDLNTGSGAAYTATMYNSQFVIDDKLVTDNVSGADDFGKGVCVIGTLCLLEHRRMTGMLLIAN